MILSLIHRLVFAGATAFFFATVFFAWLHWEERRALTTFLSELHTKSGLSKDEIVASISKAIYQATNNTLPAKRLTLYERWEADSPANVTTAVSLNHGIYSTDEHRYNGPCGTMSRVLLNALWYKGIKARKMHLCMPDGTGHTMVEYFDEGKWKVIAPSDNAFVWKNDNGSVASLKEIQNSKSVFRQIYAIQPDYPYDFQTPNHFNWDRLHAFVERKAHRWWGQEWCDEFETPWLMDQPRLLMSILSAIAFAFLGVFQRALKSFVCQRESCKEAIPSSQ